MRSNLQNESCAVCSMAISILIWLIQILVISPQSSFDPIRPVRIMLYEFLSIGIEIEPPSDPLPPALTKGFGVKERVTSIDPRI